MCDLVLHYFVVRSLKEKWNNLSQQHCGVSILSHFYNVQNIECAVYFTVHVSNISGFWEGGGGLKKDTVH
jgi:hypothetical protein